MGQIEHLERRHFLKTSAVLGLGLALPTAAFATPTSLIRSDGNMHQFGPRDGYTPQISILVSMMDWMRTVLLRSVKELSQKDLDFLLDRDSNSIGAMLLHLAATERYYQIHTFEAKPWGSWSREDKKKWDAASALGEKGRKKIKGNPLSYYIHQLSEVREHTMEELKKRDDSWLMESTNFFQNKPTNNYCKWFHVVEHESNHNGQIKYISSRIRE